MALKTSYLFWLLAALIAGAWPLALPTGHANTQNVRTVSVETSLHA